MFEAAQSVSGDAFKTLEPESTELPLIQSASLPASYSLSQVLTNIANNDGLASEEEKLQKILILRSCLENSTRVSEDGDDATIAQLSLWLSKAIVPSSSIVSHEDNSSNLPHNPQLQALANALTAASSPQDKTLLIARHKGVTGLLAFKSLLEPHSHRLPTVDTQILLSVMAFASSCDPWTTPLSFSMATSLLAQYQPQTQTKDFIYHILQQFIRPLFSKSKPEAVTASGRKAIPSSAPPRRFDAKNADERTKPWMSDVPYTITVFEWAVANVSIEIARSQFHLFIPPLLTLLDSTHTPIRSRALTILSTFIALLTPTLLTQTGLGEVFEDAVTPTLMFLPSLTPIDESMQLLEPAYHALIVLGDVWYSEEEIKDGNRYDGKDGAKAKREHWKKKEVRFLNRQLRKGVLMGYAHASEHPAIVEVLLRNLNIIISKMGIQAVSHLKDILPILTTTLTDPFAPSRPSLLLAAIKTLQTTILNCWPRLSQERYRIEIISTLILCWTNISQASQDDQHSLEEVKGEIKIAGRMLVEAVEGDRDAWLEMKRELGEVFEVDEGLRDVFGMGSDEG